MNCNGIRLNIFVAVYLMIALLHFTTSEQSEEEDPLGESGSLYDLLKRRLEKIPNEVKFDVGPEGLNEGALSYNVEGMTSDKRAINDCLYEEFKRRVDKIYTDLAQNPNKSFKRKINAIRDRDRDGDDIEDKRSTIKECLLEEYKKRLDKINNDVGSDGEKVFDRSGRSFFEKNIDAPPKCTSTENELSEPKKAVPQSKCNKHIKNNKYVEQTKARLNSHGSSNEKNFPDFKLVGNTGASKHIKLFGRDHPEKLGTSITLESAKNLVEESASRDFDDQSNESEYEDDNQRQSAFSYGDETVSYGTELSTSYPAVLTKAFETNLNPIGPTPANLLATVARSMNTSTLELAHKLTTMSDLDTNSIKNDPKLAAILQKYITNTVGTEITPKLSVGPSSGKGINNAVERQPKETSNSTECEASAEGNSTVDGNIAEVLEKILIKLERIQQEKNNASDKEANHPEGAPCDVLGSWNSCKMGLRFEITMGKTADRQLSKAESGNKALGIEALDTIPPRHKTILDTDWKFMGSTMKQLGGPLFMYSQQRADNMVALFAGYCRTCGGMDTIFGSWTFLSPSKDCQDISTSIENRHDILRRFRMTAKRKQRFKEILFAKSHYGKTQACVTQKV